MMAGTLGYTPPEQWQSSAEPRSDVYALGATLHTLLTGYQPAFTEADIPAIVMGKQGAFPAARSLDPSIAPQVEQLITQCMEFDVSKRPTATDMLKTLDTILDGFKQKQHGSSSVTIKTPNGVSVASHQELAAWCEKHWQDACQWLKGQLPDVVEKGWLDAHLAKQMRDVRTQYYQDINAALDVVIELLDPSKSRTAQITIRPESLNFGSVTPDEKDICKTIRVNNTGTRYVRLTLVTTSDWAFINAADKEFGLMPGKHREINVPAQVAHKNVGGTHKSRINLTSHNGLQERIPIRVKLPLLRTIVQKLFDLNRKRSVVLFILLALLSTSLVAVVDFFNGELFVRGFEFILAMSFLSWMIAYSITKKPIKEPSSTYGFFLSALILFGYFSYIIAAPFSPRINLRWYNYLLVFVGGFMAFITAAMNDSDLSDLVLQYLRQNADTGDYSFWVTRILSTLEHWSICAD